jgi:hypothetical protein
MCKNGPKSVGQFYGVDRKGGWGVDHKRGGGKFSKTIFFCFFVPMFQIQSECPLSRPTHMPLGNKSKQS